MDLATTLTVVGGLLAAAFTGWAAYETRRQRQAGGSPSKKSAPAPSPQVRSATWACGIYDYSPLSCFPPGRDTAPSGLLVDLITEILERLGQAYQFTRFNYDGFYTPEGRIPDLVVGMFETRRRRERMRFSRPIHEIGLQGICRSNQSGDVLEGLRSGALRVAVYSGEVGWEFVVDELPDAMDQHRAGILGGGHQRDTMSLLAPGAFDVVLMDEVSCVDFLRQGTNRRRFKLAFPHPPQTFDACVAVKAAHAGRLPEIDREISRIRNSSWFLDREAKALKGFEGVVQRRSLRASE